MSVILETTIGDLVVDLFTAERPRGKRVTVQTIKCVQEYSVNLITHMLDTFLFGHL